MPFIPHNRKEVHAMLQDIGMTSMDQLFSEIPPSLHTQSDHNDMGLSEQAITRHMRSKASMDREQLCFIGAGAYEHFIPSAVWQLTSRGEFYTAYTPYQAEASQGMLQVIYEFQTMMARLMAMDIANASLYEGASALAEAVLMAIRIQKRKSTRKILIAGAISPHYHTVLTTICSAQHITFEYTPPSKDQGCFDPKTLGQYDENSFAAIIIAQPNFLGQLQAVDDICNWAKEHNTISIALVNPMAMALIKPPGEWGEAGADIACGEGQPFGIPLASGGPYLGFMTCKKSWVRQLPGRIVGRTVDQDNRPCFCLTLQAREQHIRRSKATSNICTNQGLFMVAATIYLSLMGDEGLYDVATRCHQNALSLAAKLTQIPGVKSVFDGPCFHEFVVELPTPVAPVLAQLSKLETQAGFDLSTRFTKMDKCLLVCTTEVHTEQDLNHFAEQLKMAIQAVSQQPLVEDEISC